MASLPSLDVRESARPNKLFRRLASVLDLNDHVAEALISDLMARVDATASTLNREQLKALRADLITVVETLFPPEQRAAACARLEALVQEGRL